MSISGLNIASRLDVTCISLLPFQPGGNGSATVHPQKLYDMWYVWYGTQKGKSYYCKLMFQTFADLFGISMSVLRSASSHPTYGKENPTENGN